MAGRKRKITQLVDVTEAMREVLVPPVFVAPVPAYAEVNVLPIAVGNNGKPRDRRCRHCGKLLCRAWLQKGSGIEIRCGRCGRVSTWIGGKAEGDIVLTLDPVV
jgi:phage FluMu protein Com